MAGTLDLMFVNLAFGERSLRMTAAVTDGKHLAVDQKHRDPMFAEIDFEPDSF
jgi:hypothetical protein